MHVCVRVCFVRFQDRLAEYCFKKVEYKTGVTDGKAFALTLVLALGLQEEGWGGGG